MSERVELRCPAGHLHGETVGRYLRRKCKQCSSEAGRPVYHVFTWDGERWRVVGPGEDAEAVTLAHAGRGAE